MAKRKLFGSVIALAETTIEKTESVLYETLNSIEYGAKSLTNVMEEFHNDTMIDVLDSRLAVAEKLETCNSRLKTLGFSQASDQGLLHINRRHTANLQQTTTQE